MKLALTTVNKLLMIDGIFEGGRMFVGATSTTYLLSSGLSLSEVALLKTFQALVFILAELPTGIFADALGRRLSLLCSCIISILGFLLFYFGSSLGIFICAEIFLALSLCFWSGAFEAYAIDIGNLDKNAMHIFFHKNKTINCIAVLLFGLLGGWLGSLGLRGPYLAAAGTFAVLGLFLLTLTNDNLNNKSSAESSLGWWDKALSALKHQFEVHIKVVTTGILIKKSLFGFLLAQIGVQFLIQPLLHYWQPYFTNLNSIIGPKELGYIFSLYSGTSIIGGVMASSLSRYEWFKSSVLNWTLFSVSSILFLTMGLVNHLYLAVIIFALLQGVLSIARTALSVRINSNLSNETRASILSFISLLSRFGMILSLAVLGKLNSPRDCFSYYSVIAILSLSTIGVYLYGQNKLKNLNENHNCKAIIKI